MQAERVKAVCPRNTRIFAKIPEATVQGPFGIPRVSGWSGLTQPAAANSVRKIFPLSN